RCHPTGARRRLLPEHHRAAVDVGSPYGEPRSRQVFPEEEETDHRLSGGRGSGMSEQTRRAADQYSGVVIKDLHKSFGDNEVLKGISITVNPGEVVCLIGASGSGKSTLLRCVNRLEDPDSGQVDVGAFDATQVDVNLDAMRRRIGMVFQQFTLCPLLSGLENCTITPRRVLRQSRQRAESEAK